MRSLSVGAKNREGAQALCETLRAFRPELDGNELDGYRVVISCKGLDRDVVAALDVIEAYVSSRNDGSASVELDGHRYILVGRDGGEL
jgi:hypothetical protein